MTDYALWGNAPTGLPGSATDFGAPTSCCTLFKVTSAGISLKGYRWYDVDASQTQSNVRFALWHVTGLHTGTVVTAASVTSGTLTIGTNANDILLSTPVGLTSGDTYAAVVGDDHFGLLSAYWGGGQSHPGGLTNGPLTAFSDLAGNGGTNPDPNGNNQGGFQQSSNDPTAAFPSTGFSSNTFWVSPIVTDAGAAVSSALLAGWPP